MIRDTVTVITRWLSTWDVEECRCVSKTWREVFEDRPLQTIVRRGYVYFTRVDWSIEWSCDDVMVSYGVRRWHSDAFFGCCVPVNGHRLSIINSNSEKKFDTFVNVLGRSLHKLPVYMALPVERSVSVRPFSKSGIDTTVAFGWSFDLQGPNLTVTTDSNLYSLYAPSYGPAPRKLVDVGFIMIGEFLWCGDVEDVSAVRAASDSGRIYVHVLAAVYFCGRV